MALFILSRIKNKLIRNWGLQKEKNILILLTIVANESYSLDIMNLRNQSSHRCPGGIVARGNLYRDVRNRCGDPINIANKQDLGPIWIYHFRQDRFMFYLAFLHGNLQRIASAPYNPDKPECLDIRWQYDHLDWRFRSRYIQTAGSIHNAMITIQWSFLAKLSSDWCHLDKKYA